MADRLSRQNHKENRDVMLCILLYSACPNADTLSTAIYKKKKKKKPEKDFAIKVYNTTTIICLLEQVGFSIFLKSLSVVAFLMATGNLFHSFGPHIAKDLSRKCLHLLLGILSNLLPLDPVSFSKS